MDQSDPLVALDKPAALAARCTICNPSERTPFEPMESMVRIFSGGGAGGNAPPTAMVFERNLRRVMRNSET